MSQKTAFLSTTEENHETDFAHPTDGYSSLQVLGPRRTQSEAGKARAYHDSFHNLPDKFQEVQISGVGRISRECQTE